MMLHLALVAGGRAVISDPVRQTVEGRRCWREVLTTNGQLHKQNNTDFEAEDVKDEMTEVVGTDTVVDPGTVAADRELEHP